VTAIAFMQKVLEDDMDLFISWVKTNLPLPSPFNPLHPFFTPVIKMKPTLTNYNNKISFSYNFNQYWKKKNFVKNFFRVFFKFCRQIFF